MKFLSIVSVLLIASLAEAQSPAVRARVALALAATRSMAHATPETPLVLPRAIARTTCGHDSCVCGCNQGGGCTCAGGNRIALADEYRWQGIDETQSALMHGGKQIGAYRFADKAYRTYDASQLGEASWGEFCRPPVEPPQKPEPIRVIQTSYAPSFSQVCST